ncbi:intraflagellar transport protein 20 homolog [Vanessa tameamea]|uniref:Intraflagellar transport protein 20 homolog n=1 Tax=Vanessa tameamea TaxID=334116 RepID=A0A8B8IF08_VANTA|nr:intraflagellar transport protein 20 homolog isoform X2 [Vanessa tameamea]XP_047528347.1 intraflagellar transport protein 20 homolog [Vanessa atalanta]
MADELEKVHLHYDDINKIRVIDSTVLKETEDLKNSCKDYDTKVQDFGNIITSLLNMLKELGDNVERQKMAAIGATNLLKSIAKDRESEQAKLQSEINDKSMILEQLDSEYDALQILEATQTETIEYLTQLR